MLKFSQWINAILMAFQSTHTPLREKLISSLTACFSIFCLLLFVEHIALGLPFKMLVLASMGASAFLLFVVPHSPMAQPWPVFGGHLSAAFIGVACARWIHDPAWAAALAVLLSVLVMYFLDCLHPPSVATAMIAVLGGPELHAIGWQFCYEVVAINAGLMVALAVILNNIVPGRRYPMRHTHHTHHDKFARQEHPQYPKLLEEDFNWALSQMDGLVDVSAEDLVDLYEFAVERSEKRRQLESEKSDNQQAG